MSTAAGGTGGGTGTGAGHHHHMSEVPATIAKPVVQTRLLYVHPDTYSKSEFLLDPVYFPNVQPGDVFEIYDPTVPGDSTTRLVMQWTGIDKDTPLKAPVQVSLASHIAKIFELSPRQDVVVQKVDPSLHAAKYVEVIFRDQYIGRSDMWRLRTGLVGSCVHEGKKILFAGCIRVQVKEIHIGGEVAASAYISSETRVIFRSESAKYFIFIQMSREMWDFDEDGEIFFEKVIFGFLPNLFARWRGKRDGKTELEPPVNHVVSIVLFSRIFYQEEEESKLHLNGNLPGDTKLQKDEQGRLYQDFYKVVIDWESRSNWTTAIIPLKEEVMRYQKDILLRSSGEYSVLAGENSFAFEGNVLEAINLALNPLDKHYIDRDLQRTGLSIVMITPGSGIFDVDKRLLRLTTERMISGGIGLDMICLSKVPAHIVPLFRWRGYASEQTGLLLSQNAAAQAPTSHNLAAHNNNNNNNNFVSHTSGNGNGPHVNLMVRSTSAVSRPTSRPPSIKDASGEAKSGPQWTRAFKQPPNTNPAPDVQHDTSEPLYYDLQSTTFPAPPTKTFYMMPHWVDCMYYDSSRRPNTQKFNTRCKMYELQMMGIMEHEIASISIPYLDENNNLQQSPYISKRLSVASDLMGGSGRSHHGPLLPARPVDYDKYDEEMFYDAKTPLANELRQLKLSQQAQKGLIRETLSLNQLNSTSEEPKVASTQSAGHRKSEDYLGGGDRIYNGRHGNTRGNGGELSRSLPRVWNTNMVMPGTVNGSNNVHNNGQNIPENRNIMYQHNRDNPVPGRVSFSLKSANGFLEETRAAKQAAASRAAAMEPNDADIDVINDPDDARIDAVKYGRPMNTIDIKSNGNNKQGQHHRASTDDDPSFLSSSTVKPIFIMRSNRSVQDEANSEISAADSCHTGSVSSDKGYRLYMANANGNGMRMVQKQRFRQTYINPSNPPKTVIRLTSHLRRWQHAFPRTNRKSPTSNLVRSDVYGDGLSNTEPWRGLMSPASLPLTTGYFPTRDELQELYSEYIHTISPSEESNGYTETDNIQVKKATNLIKELIYQRLAQGFQLIVGTGSATEKALARAQSNVSANSAPAGTVANGSDTLAVRAGARAESRAALEAAAAQSKTGLLGAGSDDGFFCNDVSVATAINGANGTSTLGGNANDNKACYLSMGQQVHKLSIDSADGNVEVKRYERRLGYKPGPINYRCVIWSKHMEGYTPRNLMFSYPSQFIYQWNYLDHLVSGYQDELTEDLMYWRARFILIPTENISPNSLTAVSGEQLDDEELRLAGFQKFLDLFQKARWTGPEDLEAAVRSNNHHGGNNIANHRQDNSVKVQLITCSFAAWASSELAKSDLEAAQSSNLTMSSLPENERLNKSSKIQTIAMAIQNPITGIKLQDRRWHLRVYGSVFLGNEVVDWLIHNFVDLDTREEATDFGKKLFEKGLFIHCLGKHNFMDGHYFYQFSGEYAPTGKQARGWFRNTAHSLTKRDVDLERLLSREKEKEKEKEREKEKEKEPLETVQDRSLSGIGINTSTVNNSSTNSKSGSLASLVSSPVPVGGPTGAGALVGQTSSSSLLTGTPNATGSGSSMVHTTGLGGNFTGLQSLRERAELKKPARRVQMSKPITIDVDPNKRSDRRETAVLHYDMAHNIKHCYHFQLHWLGCTSRLIDELMQSWGRTAERCGLKLIEVPIAQAVVDKTDNPFVIPIPIKLALRPPPSRGFYEPATQQPGGPNTEPIQVPKLHFLTELVKQHGFILDMESDELYPSASQLIYSYRRQPYKNIQYVHRSGVAFIQICHHFGTANEVDENGDPREVFLWVNNTLLTSHSVVAPDGEQRGGDWDRTKNSLEGPLGANNASGNNGPNTSSGGNNPATAAAGGGGPGGAGGNSNTSNASSNKNSSNQVPNPDVLRRKFIATCSDPKELERIWGEVSSHLETISGIQDILEDVPDENVVERPGVPWVMPQLAPPRRPSVTTDTESMLDEKEYLTKRQTSPTPAPGSSTTTSTPVFGSAAATSTTTTPIFLSENNSADVSAASSAPVSATATMAENTPKVPQMELPTIKIDVDQTSIEEDRVLSTGREPSPLTVAVTTALAEAEATAMPPPATPGVVIGTNLGDAVAVPTITTSSGKPQRPSYGATRNDSSSSVRQLATNPKVVITPESEDEDNGQRQ